MKHRTAIFLALLFCAGQGLALERDASQPYRPLGESQQWTISGRMHGPFKIALRINGQLVFDASMDAQPTGIYRDKAGTRELRNASWLRWSRRYVL